MERKYPHVIGDLRKRLGAWAQPVLVGLVPAYVLVMGIAHYMLNHFFVRAPYLLDTGMLSALSYRNGLLLAAPKVALNYVEYYYDVYFSPLTSLFSVLSYIVPVGRVEWYVIIQAAVYAPIGLAVYLIASRLDPKTALRRVPITMIAAVAFSVSGLVLWMVGYPHFEPAMPGFACMMLAALVTGRTRLAWVCLVLTASVRQDGGIHAATALAPVLFLHWRRYAMMPSRRTLILMIAVAVGLSVIGMLTIKLFFTPFPRLAQAYLGDPLYSHLSTEVLADRARAFIDNNQVIYYPFLATCLVAALRRDAGYLLGWASTLPWFAFCFLAVEQVKSTFFGYGVGPFLVGVLWCYLYGAHLAPAPRRMRAGALEVAFALVCLASTLGMYRANPVASKFVARDMAIAKPRDRDAVHTFLASIHQHRPTFGRLQVDGAVATLALEYLQPPEVWPHGSTDVDTVVFHRQSPEALPMVSYVLGNELESCAQVRGTSIMMCTRNRLPAETFAGVEVDRVPAAFVSAIVSRRTRNIVTFEERGARFRTAHVVYGWFGTLPRGTYEWTMTLAPEQPLQLEGSDLAALEVVQGQAMVASTTATRDAREIALRFDANEDPQPLAYRVRSFASSPLVFTNVRLRRVEAP